MMFFCFLFLPVLVCFLHRSKALLAEHDRILFLPFEKKAWRFLQAAAVQ
jgi:hypothetical protein